MRCVTNKAILQFELFTLIAFGLRAVWACPLLLPLPGSTGRMTVSVTTRTSPQALPATTKLHNIRSYQPNDKPAVLDICKNVYNGTDYLPRLIDHFAERPDTTILVSQPHGSSAIQGTMAGHKRGSAWFLFGLRVHEAARGNGVAKSLMEHICRACNDHGPVKHITSATIPQNPAANKLLQGVGLVHTHTVDLWPTYATLSDYEKAVGFVPGAGELPDYHTSLLDYAPGVRSLITAAGSSLGVTVDDWVQCSSLQQLEQAVASIRQQQQLFEPELQQVPSSVPMDCLPWVYETWPLDAPYVQSKVESGNIWLLHHPATTAAAAASQGALRLQQQQQPYRAVVLFDWSLEFRRKCCGILTASDAFVPAALEFVGSREPHFVAFIDRGSRHSSGAPEEGLVLPEVLSLPEGDHSCFSVYAMPAAHAHL